MRNRFLGLIFTVLAVLFIVFIRQPDQNVRLEFPTSETVLTHFPQPTEYIKRRENRQEFKKRREEWIREMHKSHPDDDWEEMDRQTRREKADDIIRWRKELLDAGLLVPDYSSRETAGGSVEGVWRERGSNNLSGRIHTAEIDFENELIYCASSGGNIWKGTLSGSEWISLTDYLRIPGIHMLRLIEFDDTWRLLIAASGSFHYTDNDGLTLGEAVGLDFVQDWGWAVRTVVKNDEQHTIYILATEWDYVNWNPVGVLYKSVDRGETFAKIMEFNADLGFDVMQNYYEFDIWTPRYGSGDLYLMNDGDLYVIDENDNLSLHSSFTPSGTGDNLLIGGVQHRSIFLYTRIDENIYFSSDGGRTWVDKGVQPEFNFFRTSFNCSNFNPDIVLIGGVDLFRSSDNAESWQRVNYWWEYYDDPENKLHADIPEVHFFPTSTSDEVAYISTDGGLYVSNDNIATVENLSLYGLGVSQYYSTYTRRDAPHHVYAGSQDQGFQRSLYPADGILEFEQSISGDYGHIVSGDGGLSLWTNYPGFTMYYANPETDSWGQMLDFPGSNYLWLAPLMAGPYNAAKAYLGGGGVNGGAHLIELTATLGGITYTELPYDFTQEAGERISAMAFSPIDHSYRYVLTTGGHFFNSSDDGSNWQLSEGFTGPESHYFYGSTIYPSKTQLGHVIIGGSGYSNSPVYKSTNHGVTFTEFDNGLPNTLVFEITGNEDESQLFAATEVGPYVFVEQQQSWEDLSGINTPDQVYWAVDYVHEISTARFGTYGRGIWDFDMSSDSALVEEPEVVANAFRLFQNYPNPFNASTKIRYAIPEDSEVRITIYDIRGREVAELVSGRMESGIHEVEWDASEVSSGVYLCRLSIGNSQFTTNQSLFTQKMVVVK